MIKHKHFLVLYGFLFVLGTFGQGVALNSTITFQEEIDNTATLQGGLPSQGEPDITHEPPKLATRIQGKPVHDAKIEPKKPTFRVRLRSVEFTPMPGMQPELKAMTSEVLAKMPMGKAPIPEYIYVLMQFNDDTLSTADFNMMQMDGVSFLGYLPEDTYIAKIPISKAQAISYPSTRWIGILSPDQKISPKLKEELNGRAQIIDITLEFFEPIKKEEYELIENLSERILSYSNASEHNAKYITVEINASMLNQLADFNSTRILTIIF